MPMDPMTLLPIMTSNLTSSGLVGPNLPQLALGLATGLSTYVLGSVIVRTIDVGTAGAGVGVGVGIIVPTSIYGFMTSSFIANGIVGIFGPSLSFAVSNAIIQSFSLGIINTVSAGVGVGSGVCSLVTNPNLSLSSFLTGLISAGMVGVNVTQLATAVSVGLDLALAVSFGFVAIAGPPSPVGASGTGFGKIL